MSFSSECDTFNMQVFNLVNLCYGACPSSAVAVAAATEDGSYHRRGGVAKWYHGLACGALWMS